MCRLSQTKFTILSVVTTGYSPEYGGLEKAAYNFSKELATRGHKVLFLGCSNLRSTKKSDGALRVDILHLPQPRQRNLSNVLFSLPISLGIFIAMWRRVLQYRPQIIHAHDTFGFVCAIMCRMFIRLSIVFHYHNLPSNSLQLLIMREADMLLFVSKAQLDITAKKFPYVSANLQKVRIVNSSADEANTAFMNKPNEEEPFILQVGRITKVKGQDVLLSAFKEVVKRFPNMHLVFAGPTDDQSYFATLTSMVKLFGLENRVHFRGVVSPSDRDLLYRDCFIFVHPCVWPEAFGVVISEAMAHGDVIVATSAGGIVEQIENGISGLLVKPGDSHDLANALIRAISDAELRRRLATGALSNFKEKLSLRVQVNRLESVYSSLVELQVQKNPKTPVCSSECSERRIVFWLL